MDKLEQIRFQISFNKPFLALISSLISPDLFLSKAGPLSISFHDGKHPADLYSELCCSASH